MSSQSSVQNSQNSDSSSTEIESASSFEELKVTEQTQMQMIKQLKFQNNLYHPGDHIAIRDTSQQLKKDIGVKNDKEIYGQILAIAKVPNVQFPIILVSWHYSKKQGFREGMVPQYLSDRELIASNCTDWQFVESIIRKIKVHKIQKYEQIPFSQRDCCFFIRSSIDVNSDEPLPYPEPGVVCHCLKQYNPDEKMIKCIACGFEYHSACLINRYLCLYCQ